MPATHVIISLPYMDMEGRGLLTSHNVMVKHWDGAVDPCSFVSSFEAGMVMTSQSTLSSLMVHPSAITTTQGSEVWTEKERKGGYLLRMDCMSYKCKTFECRLPILQRHAQAEIDISVVFDREALIFSSKIDSILYLTDSKVAEPSTPFFYRWPEPRSENVSTLIYYVRSRSKVSIWIIVGGVVGGLLVLVIIIAVLRRLGFFRRVDKERLQRLKQESGYCSSSALPVPSRRSQSLTKNED